MIYCFIILALLIIGVVALFSHSVLISLPILEDGDCMNALGMLPAGSNGRTS